MAVAGFTWALSALPAFALQGGAVDSNADATFAGVGSLTVSGGSGGTYSAVLIAPQYVLTAGHVAGPGSDPSRYTFRVNLDALPAGERDFRSPPSRPHRDSAGS